MKNPCYDETTKTSCPKRCAGCSINCEEWAKYTEERSERYKDNLEKSYVRSSVYGTRYNHKPSYRKERARKGHKVW